jgi:hypothetical protein
MTSNVAIKHVRVSSFTKTHRQRWFFAGVMSPVEELKELKRVALYASFAGIKCSRFLPHWRQQMEPSRKGRAMV